MATFPPTAASYYPKCISHQLLGIHCPGCGLTRAAHSLLNGRLAQAFAYNPLLVLLSPYLLFALVRTVWFWLWGTEPRRSIFPTRYAWVILVVFVFLQNWRATLIPLATVPVAIIGTFALFPALGFTINMTSMFGLVLAIGIVVDDAIVVVEAVQHNIDRGMRPREATIKAMSEVSGPVVAIAFILAAVFIPVAFLGGSAADIAVQAARLDRMTQRMLQITAERTGRTVDQVDRDSARDKWFTAEEACEYGLADAVLADAAAVTPTTSGFALGLTGAS